MCIDCFKVTKENEATCTCSQNQTFTLSRRVSPVWKQFGYKKDSTGNLVKGPLTYCKLGFQSVAHGGGTVNLRSYLRLNYLSNYSNLFTDNKADENKQPRIKNSHVQQLLWKDSQLVPLAQKCLDIVATSVPSECLFSIAGNIVSAKKAV